MGGFRYAATRVAIGGVGFAVGLVAGLFIPTIELDDPFWRAFWSGPPVAGILALVGAVIAFVAAKVGAQTSRLNAERTEWWLRAQWALDLARSGDHLDRVIGLRAIEGLRDQAVNGEVTIVAAVTDTITAGKE